MLNAVDQDGATPLFYAVRHNLINTVEYLLSLEKCDVDIQLKNGMTPLLESIVLKKDELTQMLLERNADVRRVDHDGKTVLHHL